MPAKQKTTTTQRTNGFQIPPFQQPAAQPLAKTSQPASQIEAKLALMKQKQDLQIENLMGTVAAFSGLVPTLNVVAGDAIAKQEILADVIKTRGCDAASCRVEIIILDD